MKRDPKVNRYIASIHDRGFPHVANKIDWTWGTKECQEYLDTLVIDTRGNRQGFPVEVFKDILQLYFMAPLANNDDVNPWMETHYK